jgi:hypothetical protein
MPPIFFFRNCIYSYNQVVIYYGYNRYKFALISPQSFLHYQTLFPTLRDTLFASHIKLLAEASEFLMHAVFRPKNGVRRMHP